MAKCPICGKRFMYSFNKANDGTQVCSDSCKVEYNKINLMGGGEGRRGEGRNQAKESKGSTFSTIASAIGENRDRKAAREADIDAKENEVIQQRVKEITEIEIGTTPPEILNSLTKLATIGSGAGNTIKDNAVRKAVAEKMEIGIMMLRSAGNSAEADLFQKKMKKIKPKWYNY